MTFSLFSLFVFSRFVLFVFNLKTSKVLGCFEELLLDRYGNPINPILLVCVFFFLSLCLSPNQCSFF